MKVRSVQTFEKQLQQSRSHQSSKIYALLMEDPFERRYYADLLYEFFRHHAPGLLYERARCSEVSLASVFEEGLFAKERVWFLDRSEEISKEAIPVWVDRLTGLQEGNFVILGGSSCSQKLYDGIEKDVVCLDLSDEKPWDRKRRLLDELHKIARRQGKSIDSQGVELLHERIGPDFAALKNEVEKLISFIGSRDQVGISDIRQMGLVSKDPTYWQIAEGIIWETEVRTRPVCKDLSDILSLFSLIRYHLYLGLDLCHALESGNPIEGLKLRKQQLERYPDVCQRVGSKYFLRRLLILFSLEVKAKQATIDPSFLWDLFVIHSSHDTIPSTQFAGLRS